jgi:hypothetical protein
MLLLLHRCSADSQEASDDGWDGLLGGNDLDFAAVGF